MFFSGGNDRATDIMITCCGFVCETGSLMHNGDQGKPKMGLYDKQMMNTYNLIELMDPYAKHKRTRDIVIYMEKINVKQYAVKCYLGKNLHNKMDMTKELFETNHLDQNLYMTKIITAHDILCCLAILILSLNLSMILNHIIFTLSIFCSRLEPKSFFIRNKFLLKFTIAQIKESKHQHEYIYILFHGNITENDIFSLVGMHWTSSVAARLGNTAQIMLKIERKMWLALHPYNDKLSIISSTTIFMHLCVPPDRPLIETNMGLKIEICLDVYLLVFKKKQIDSISPKGLAVGLQWVDFSGNEDPKQMVSRESTSEKYYYFNLGAQMFIGDRLINKYFIQGKILELYSIKYYAGKEIVEHFNNLESGFSEVVIVILLLEVVGLGTNDMFLVKGLQPFLLGGWWQASCFFFAGHVFAYNEYLIGDEVSFYIKVVGIPCPLQQSLVTSMLWLGEDIFIFWWWWLVDVASIAFFLLLEGNDIWHAHLEIDQGVEGMFLVSELLFATSLVIATLAFLLALVLVWGYLRFFALLRISF
ncbi:hypothetical protein ACJX0J_037767 [Zea mays]